ncbi:hypothetical protein ACFT8W_40785 [Streptomyces hygroscopicus]|uniref:hypothetical protein n=1 Tax=Streptomyces hygroscopicus TaxID=1912 RepID=UPI00363A3B23
MVEVFGLSAETPPGPLVRVVVADAEDSSRMAGRILAIPDAECGRIGGGGEPGPFVRVVVADAEDSSRMAGQILAIPDAECGRIDGGGEPGPFVRVVAADAEDPYRERCVPAVG